MGLLDCVDLMALNFRHTRVKGSSGHWYKVYCNAIKPQRGKSICISAVIGGSQLVTVLEVIGTGLEALYILGIDYCRRGYFQEPKVFGVGGLAYLPWRQRTSNSCLP